MAIAGMVLGIIALVGVLPASGVVFGDSCLETGIYNISFLTRASLPCLAVGLPLSGIAFYQARQAGTNKGAAVAGLATNSVALVMIIAWGVLPAIRTSNLQ